MSDNVNHPQHYQGFSNGAEVIDITENLSFNLGNVVKYVSRAGRKTDNPLEDLKKAQFYLNREIDRLEQLNRDRPRRRNLNREIDRLANAEAGYELEQLNSDRRRRWNIIFGGDSDDEDWLPGTLRQEEGVVWVDKDGDEWRWQNEDKADPGWGYRTPSVTGWIPISGIPSDDYGPYKEKTYG